MNSFTRADGAFALLCIVVAVAVFTVIALVLFIRRVWPSAGEREARRRNPDKTQRRLADIARK
jgi:hypothetical protein